MHNISVSIEVIDLNQRIACFCEEEKSITKKLWKDGKPIGQNDGIEK
jgi:hypothetical protein